MKTTPRYRYASIRILFATALSVGMLIFSLATHQWNARLDQVLKVGDHVEYVDVYKGVVTEIGTGGNAGCYRIRSDNAGNPDYKGDMVCTLGRTGVLFLLDRNGKRVADVRSCG